MGYRTVTGKPGRRGFTLIELLIVLAIIGTLLAIAVPRYFNSLKRGRETVLRADLAVMREAIDKYYADTGQYPDTLVALAEKRYVRAVPPDPFTKLVDTWAVVSSEDADHPGIRDIHSGAPDQATDGTAVSSW